MKRICIKIANNILEKNNSIDELIFYIKNISYNHNSIYDLFTTICILEKMITLKNVNKEIIEVLLSICKEKFKEMFDSISKKETIKKNLKTIKTLQIENFNNSKIDVSLESIVYCYIFLYYQSVVICLEEKKSIEYIDNLNRIHSALDNFFVLKLQEIKNIKNLILFKKLYDILFLTFKECQQYAKMNIIILSSFRTKKDFQYAKTRTH
ncbi:MAG: hypothetical protein N2505_00210 [Endomicrobia bacterium]|nr:hypothetical protein [Endomicrobiia bacterium]